MTVEEARAALDEAELAYEKAKGTGVSNVVAASKALSAARRALATAEKAEAAGVNVGGLSRAERYLQFVRLNILLHRKKLAKEKSQQFLQKMPSIPMTMCGDLNLVAVVVTGVLLDTLRLQQLKHQ